MKLILLFHAAVIGCFVPLTSMGAQKRSSFKENLQAILKCTHRSSHAKRSTALTQSSVHRHIAQLPTGLITKLRGTRSLGQFEAEVMKVAQSLELLIKSKRTFPKTKKYTPGQAMAVINKLLHRAEGDPMTNETQPEIGLANQEIDNSFSAVYQRNPWPFWFLLSVIQPLPIIFFATAIVGTVQLAQAEKCETEAPTETVETLQEQPAQPTSM